ncbi:MULTISPECIES: flagellar basal body rod protein FlgB [unclassified Halanaerobium]|uniref:flagellar basal body rod protein FlgB n=1 Tax=unclassified Halanaerobium TaxID=2641197 RepID=UPI000DF30A96|nr:MULTISPECIES: flagellar basal body rod protein FlgB [unclassified Halanaerobium]RCW47698.1 flagellar basal-body rod protein FlgB [Halanaerobium sp. MA284_MarDTE_T2]RCW84658.1 flagellar basal-body rod protein FlgB [Halanaerobium sp. DL-01]
MTDYISLITAALDGASRRGELIANNIANATTPGYKRQDINFQQVLKRQMNGSQNGTRLRLDTTDKNHISAPGVKNNDSFKKSSFLEKSNKNGSYRNDKNNVDIDVEVAEMAKNSIYYNVLTRRAAARFSTLNQVIEKGGS